MNNQINKFLRRYALAVLSCCLLCSCIDYSDASRLVNVQVQLQAPEGFNAETDLQGKAITVSGSTMTLTAVTDADGIATFSGLFPDVYDISASWEITGDEYQTFTGKTDAEDGYIISATLNAQVLSDAQESSPVVLKLATSWRPPLVISKIYSSGSKDANNKSYSAGKYLEVYNQTGVTVNLAGLYIGLLDSTNPQPYTLQDLSDDPAIAGEKILLKQLFRIPTDRAYPLAPGRSALIVNSATDHSDVSQYESNLADADFEAKDASGRLLNNPAMPALTTVFSSTGGASATMNLVQGGPCGVVIFHTDEDVNAWDRTYGYGKTTGSQSYLLVPKTVVYDGVDFLKNKVSTGPDVSTKRLYAEIDGGYVNINAVSGWTGEVVYRRTASVTADGRRILMDTNNSTNDFQVSTTIKPREYDE